MNIGHFQNLIAVAFADGKLDADEKKLLRLKAKEFGISEKEVDELLQNPEDLAFIVPAQHDDKIEQFSEIVFIALIDGELHEKEYQICLRVAENLNLKKKDIDNALELIKKLWD